jgi:ribosomal protein S18 acetylase RimI-like enzyme
MASEPLSRRVRTAHGDAWQEEGRLRIPYGGAFAEQPGIRLMASGLPHPQWNNGDVTDAAVVDLDLVREWYACLSVPWGVRVPADQAWSHGRHLFRKRLMGLTADGFAPASMVAGLAVRAATASDVEAVVRVDCAAFGGESSVDRPWLEPHLHADAVTVALALLEGEPVGTAYTLRSDGRAGPALYLAGVGVLEQARGRGVAAAMSSWLLEQGFAAGAELAHLHPDTDSAAGIYARLGFTEVDGFDIYVDLA